MKKIKAKLSEPGTFKDQLIEYFDKLIDEISRFQENITKKLEEKLTQINLNEL